MEDTVCAEPHSELSDERRQSILIEAGLFARDPSATPGLAMQMDPASGLDGSFQPVAYDTSKTTGEMVRCSICPQRQKHFDGAIIRLQSGQLGLVGNQCGRNHFFGENGWTAVTNRIQQANDHALFLARFGTAKSALASIDALLRDWSESLSIILEVRAKFKSQLPHLFNAIRRESRSGDLRISTEIEVPFRLPNGDIEVRKEITQVPVCRIEPIWFFHDDNLGNDVEKQREKLSHAADFLHADAKPHNVSAVRKMMWNCRRSLQDVADKQKRLSSFASVSTCSKMAEWGNHFFQGKAVYSSSQKVIERKQSVTVAGYVDLGKLPISPASWEKIRELWPSL